MLRKVEIGTRVDTLYLLETERHLELDVGSGIGIMSELLMVVVTILFIAQPQRLVPFQAGLLPFLEPFKFRSGTHEELHFHLLELTHTENKLTRHNLVAESLADLGDTEGDAHAAGFLHVEVVDKYTLCRFGTEIYIHRTVSSRTHLGFEHKVELAHISPVLGAADGIHDFLVDDNLTQLVEIVIIHRIGETLVKGVAFRFMLHHAGIGLAEQRFVEILAKTFAGLCHLLLYFIFDFGYLLFNKHICTVTLLRVAVINQRVVKCVNMA